MLYCSKRFRRVPKISIQSTSIEANIWHQPQRIASLATSAVNKAASNVRKQVSNQLKKINLSPARTAAHNPSFIGLQNSSFTEGQLLL